MVQALDILDEHHILRATTGRGVDNNQVTESAFKLRKKINETYLSVDWIECQHKEKNKQDINASMQRLSNLNPQPVATLNVGDVRSINYEGNSLDVENVPNANTCHSGIFGLYGIDKHSENELKNQLAEIANKHSLNYIKKS